MAEDKAKTSQEGLSLQTLIVAAVASGVAAVVVSRVWKDGTVLAAAMTPVVVSIVKEMLQRPMKSEAVRRSASKVSSVAVAPARRVATTAGAARSRSGTGTYDTGPREPTTANGSAGNGNGAQRTGEVLHSGPRRTYGSDGRERRRRLRLSPTQLRLAIVTGVLAFVVAVAALTIPELIFGGAVSSGHRTTIFGGGSSSSSGEKDKGKDGKSNPGDNGTDQQREPTQPNSSGGTEPQTTQPQGQTQPPDTQTQTQPDTQEPPSQTQPAPNPGGTTQPAPQTPVPAPPTP